MLLDKQNMFSEAQTLVAAAGDVVSTNVIDLGVARNIGADSHSPLDLLAQIVTTYAATGGASTVTLKVQTSPDNSSWTTLAHTDAIAKATLVQGYRFALTSIPSPTSRYLRLVYTIATNDGTSGAVTAGLVASVDSQASYARGYTA